jgi:hypothetical protein
MTSRGQQLDKWLDDQGSTDLPEDWRLYCAEKRPDLDPDVVWEDFCDYWIAATGQNSYKRSWQRTWNRWVRNQKTSNTGANPRPLEYQPDDWKPEQQSEQGREQGLKGIRDTLKFH